MATQWELLRDELGYNLPKVFSINTFRTAQDGAVTWPGHGDNIRLMKWIWQRIEGTGKGVGTADQAVSDKLRVDKFHVGLSRGKTKHNCQKQQRRNPWPPCFSEKVNQPSATKKVARNSKEENLPETL